MSLRAPPWNQPSSHTQCSNCSQQLAAMPERRDAKLLWSSAVRSGRTVSSISRSRNAASYFPGPRLRSQATMSMTALKLRDCSIALL